MLSNIVYLDPPGVCIFVEAFKYSYFYYMNAIKTSWPCRHTTIDSFVSWYNVLLLSYIFDSPHLFKNIN